VRFAEALGAETLVHVALDGGGEATVRIEGRSGASEGEAVGLSADPARLYRFDAVGKRLR
jgi:ABC-type sugar transport system ATPase subunit